jgi:hypothetical protein
MFFRPRRNQPPAMTLEGVLGPNNRLDDAEGAPVEAPEALCVAGDGSLLFSSGRRVLSLGRWGEEPKLWACFDQAVSALRAGPGGLVAVGMEGGRVTICDSLGRPAAGWSPNADLTAATDIVFVSEDEIAVLDNGYRAGESVLSLVPWDEGARGRIVAIRRGGEGRVLASGLHCPMGICRDATGQLIVSLLERASIVDAAGKTRQSGYPGYLGRIRKVDSGYLMTCLSRRDPLIEFLKGEPGFVAEMKAKIEPRHWIGPRGTPEFSHDFPIELGAARLFGAVKPWAPSFSYGLIIALDDRLMPVASAHSRANGFRHAISDAEVWNGDLVAVSKASSELLNLGAWKALA